MKPTFWEEFRDNMMGLVRFVLAATALIMGAAITMAPIMIWGPGIVTICLSGILFGVMFVLLVTWITRNCSTGC